MFFIPIMVIIVIENSTLFVFVYLVIVFKVYLSFVYFMSSPISGDSLLLCKLWPFSIYNFRFILENKNFSFFSSNNLWVFFNKKILNLYIFIIQALQLFKLQNISKHCKYVAFKQKVTSQKSSQKNHLFKKKRWTLFLTSRACNFEIILELNH